MNGDPPDDATSSGANLRHLFLRSLSRSTPGRNLLELVLLAGDFAPRVVVSTEAYRRLRRALSRTPGRYEPHDGSAIPFTVEGWRERKLASASTDLCIEGFPGSGNSFVSNCVRRAVNHPVNIESHFHQTVQLKRALSFRVPAVVVVRDPAGACESLRSKEPRLAEWVVLLRWIHYHRWVARHLESLEVFLFRDLIEDVDLLRRRSAVVANLVARTIEPHTEFQRASRKPAPISRERVLSRWLLPVAWTVYEEIETACRDRPQRARR